MQQVSELNLIKRDYMVTNNQLKKTVDRMSVSLAESNLFESEVQDAQKVGRMSMALKETNKVDLGAVGVNNPLAASQRVVPQSSSNKP